MAKTRIVNHLNQIYSILEDSPPSTSDELSTQDRQVQAYDRIVNYVAGFREDPNYRSLRITAVAMMGLHGIDVRAVGRISRERRASSQ